MIRENVLTLAEDFRKQALPEFRGVCPHFDMRDWFIVPENICGTRMCIAGAAVLRFRPELMAGEGWKSVDYRMAGAEALGLDWSTASQLFLPPEIVSRHHGRDLRVAAKVLERLAETGKVDWIQAVVDVEEW